MLYQLDSRFPASLESSAYDDNLKKTIGDTIGGDTRLTLKKVVPSG
jgi:hypothetical protein